MDVETASLHSETASDFSEVSRQSTIPKFTCLSCHVYFPSPEAQRDHMHGDWHRYNLKRKVAELPPVTAENFAAKLKQIQVKNKEDETRAAFVGECEACSKSYASENGYANHLLSKKHKELQSRFDAKLAKGLPTSSKKPAPAASAAPSSSSADPQAESWRTQIGKAQTEEEVMSIMEKKVSSAVRLEETECLFCQAKSGSFESNLEHMAKSHSFYIPDIEYLVDIKGLIKYLGEKVAVYNVCLYCNGKGRALHSIEAVRKHMVDKGHCKILYEDGAELEVADFYDFSSTYPDEVAEDGDRWEGTRVSLDTTEFASPARHLPRTSDPLRTIRITPDETQLILPSGARIGHRQYRHFWRQNLKPDDSRDSTLIHRLAGQYQTLGYQGLSYEQRVAAHERRMVAKVELRRQHDFRSRVGMKANMLQHHYREQNPM
ncbi:C2H2 type zinc-finger-domain-containing protein [Blyttiomyces helicus]|uniref:C2H2 type zinc-finger-domain-containing protein n=1 Tax=Blyttiomyces helicus TaxID=388810 RepID=A0A4P9WK24_9FUNG|nr:C2H2 type zinc-finger-domain-containing protein [Blyttiomyces helicus]|eukprot:RKO93144.1 C2H2 type zinc-finger-domain-containing protein [Blyttiomyces helicus]